MLYAHLRLCSAAGNHNKEYIMEQLDDHKIKVSYGRYGAALMTKLYPVSKWDSLYAEKCAKGYKDITGNKDIVSEFHSEYAEIKDSIVSRLVDKLLSYANEFVKKSYSIKTEEVTVKMVNAAQKLINSLSDAKNVSEFNSTLELLFTVLPRKVKCVSDLLAASELDYEEIVRREQDLLDTMAVKVNQNTRHSSSTTDKDITILQEMGLDVRCCTEEEENMVKKYLGESAHLFDSAFYVKNVETENAFDDYCKKHNIGKKDIHFFYHGSRNENFWSILCNGLKLRPNAKITGKMFGYGIYFAPLAKKSIGYTSILNAYWTHGNSHEGYLAVFKVAYKKPYDVHTHESRFTSFTYSDIAKRGCDAMFAHKGTMLYNDEVIVYKEEQCTIRFLVKLKA